MIVQNTAAIKYAFLSVFVNVWTAELKKQFSLLLQLSDTHFL